MKMLVQKAGPMNNEHAIINETNNSRKFALWQAVLADNTKYIPIKVIGKGSYGVVCSSINKYTKERVAIKKISNVFDYEEGPVRALRELRILRHIRHENVIALKDVLVTSSRSSFNEIFLVYELMDGDLHSVIHSPKVLSNDHCKYFMFQLLKGLSYLHSADIIHRDLKPGNLLVNANFDLKICDFGLARTCKAGQSQSMTEYVMTRWYRAPELLLSSNKYGSPVDVWSVGCIFAELLGRKPIFQGKDSIDQVKKIINVLGTQDETDLRFISEWSAFKFIRSLPRTPGIAFVTLFPEADPLALNLLERMLVFNPDKRMTIPELLEHRYLSGLYDPELFRPAPSTCDLDTFNVSTGSDKLRSWVWNEMILYHPELWTNGT